MNDKKLLQQILLKYIAEAQDATFVGIIEYKTREVAIEKKVTLEFLIERNVKEAVNDLQTKVKVIDNRT